MIDYVFMQSVKIMIIQVVRNVNTIKNHYSMDCNHFRISSECWMLNNK